MKWSNRAN